MKLCRSQELEAGLQMLRGQSLSAAGSSGCKGREGQSPSAAEERAHFLLDCTPAPSSGLLQESLVPSLCVIPVPIQAEVCMRPGIDQV